jgi:hypothetical protein
MAPKTPVAGWPSGDDVHTPTEAEKSTGRVALWMLLIAAAVVVLGYLLVNRMLGF